MHSRAILPFDFVPGTVRENLGALEGEEERCRRLAQVVGLAASLDKDPAELSVGQRKRLEILMVLLKPAELYILDEPLAGIDVLSKSKIMQAILEATQGKTLLVIMHGDAEFHGQFDRVLDLAAGATEEPALVAAEA
jgi:ABC-type multidrug transport system ATPase subunit